jgi:hypothetical protein
MTDVAVDVKDPWGRQGRKANRVAHTVGLDSAHGVGVESVPGALRHPPSFHFIHQAIVVYQLGCDLCILVS